MTYHPIRVEADGTRVYANYHRYKPLPPEQRKYGVNKPDDPRAERFHGRWFLPLQLLDDGSREMPETKPDDIAYEHAKHTLLCFCDVCRRPDAERWRSKWRRDRRKGLV